jgi:predicted ester cyclase
MADGDQVLIEVRWIGTNSGPYRGTPATDKVVDVPIAYIFKFRGDQICAITEYYDGATVGAQLS